MAARVVRMATARWAEEAVRWRRVRCVSMTCCLRCWTFLFGEFPSSPSQSSRRATACPQRVRARSPPLLPPPTATLCPGPPPSEAGCQEGAGRERRRSRLRRLQRQPLPLHPPEAFLAPLPHPRLSPPHPPPPSPPLPPAPHPPPTATILLPSASLLPLPPPALPSLLPRLPSTRSLPPPLRPARPSLPPLPPRAPLPLPLRPPRSLAPRRRRRGERRAICLLGQAPLQKE